MAIKKVLIIICFTPILFAFYYRVSDCYGDFSVAWSTAEITHDSDEARICTGYLYERSRYGFSE